MQQYLTVPGWTIDCDKGVWQKGIRDYAGHSCSNWYGYTSSIPIGSISTTFNGMGRARQSYIFQVH